MQYSFKSRSGKFALHTSSKELQDLAIAWIMVSLAFTILRSESAFFSTGFLIGMLISALTVGIAFLLHELAHKVVAQRYKCWAEFRADMTFLVLGVLMSFMGFTFIAPGAVMIFGHIDYRQNGKISLAGPMTNIILSILFLPLLFMEFSPLISEIINSGYLINAWLAAFNMIPIGNFDGRKIYAWSRKAYFMTLGAAVLLLFVFFMI